MVWRGRRLQCNGDGTARTKSGGSIQFLLKKIQLENRAFTCRSIGTEILSMITQRVDKFNENSVRFLKLKFPEKSSGLP